jgi:hypothetical protein
MDSSLVIPALCGLKDSINPCHSVTVFCLIFLVSELRKRHLDASWHAAVFIAAVFLALFQFNFGALMPVMYSDGFYEASRVIYLVIGFLFFMAGAFHLRDWWYLRYPGPKRSQFFAIVTDEGRDMRQKGGVRAIAVTVAAAVGLSAISTIWPADPYILYNASFSTLPGKLPEVYLILFVYHFVFVLPMLGIFIFVSSGYFSRAVKKAPAMVKVILASLTMSLGTGLIYIFQ